MTTYRPIEKTADNGFNPKCNVKGYPADRIGPSAGGTQDQHTAFIAAKENRRPNSNDSSTVPPSGSEG